MASEIAHIALAAKYDRSKIGQPDIRDFFVGTVFPDIRYLKILTREKTHVASPSLTAVRKAHTAFEAGMIFHALVDKIREDFLERNNGYSLCPPSKYAKESMKLYEDKLFYPLVRGWPVLVRYFDTVHPMESVKGASESATLRWHKILQNYFAQTPSDTSREKFAAALGFSQEATDEINRNVSALSHSKEAYRLTQTWYDHFDELIEKHDSKLVAPGGERAKSQVK